MADQGLMQDVPRSPASRARETKTYKQWWNKFQMTLVYEFKLQVIFGGVSNVTTLASRDYF